MQFINPQEAEAKVAARYRVILIFWTAMLGSLAFLLILALVVPGSGTPNQTLTFALLGIGLTVVIIPVIVKQSLLRQSIEKQQLQLLVNTYVISFALCESAALFGLMDHFVTGSVYYPIAFIIAAVGMLLHFPKKDHVRAVSYKKF